MQGTTNAAMKRNSFGDESEMESVHWSVSFFNNHKYTCGALSRHMHVESVIQCVRYRWTQVRDRNSWKLNERRQSQNENETVDLTKC